MSNGTARSNLSTTGPASGAERRSRRVAAALAGVLLISGVAAATPPALFAEVDGTPITQAELERTVAISARGRFYHGEIPPAQLAAFREEVAGALIDQALLVAEAERRGLAADGTWVEGRVRAVDRRYAGVTDWPVRREALLADLRVQLEGRSKVRRLAAQVRAAPHPDPEAVRGYYAAHPELFTEPERDRVSVILLKVEPSAPTADWEAALERGRQLVAQLRGGASFAVLARRHSQDRSADGGGDLGYLHRGMLGSGAQEAIDALAPGEFSDAVQLLEGVAVLRLEAREPAHLKSFDSVADRARALWTREQGEQAWQRLLARLRGAARIRVADPALRGLLEQRSGSTGMVVSKRAP